MIYVLYNPHAGNGRCKERAEHLRELYPAQKLQYINMTEIRDYRAFIHDSSGAPLILCGGDGTLNRFVNDTDEIAIENQVLYFPAGSGNDFARDLGIEGNPTDVSSFLKNLPFVFVNGKRRRFINGIGYGIDGYCCEEGDRLRKKTDKAVNYAAIAVKGLLFHYSPTSAVVSVDGMRFTFDKVWLAPTMNGRYYGGGMCPTPQRNRLNQSELSVMIMHSAGKLKTLAVFPTIFSGKHTAHTEMLQILTGKEIEVEFDRPVALQIDGETESNISSYRAVSALAAAERGFVHSNG